MGGGAKGQRGSSGFALRALIWESGTRVSGGVGEGWGGGGGGVGGLADDLNGGGVKGF
jgi:hypothetical protein